MSIVTDGGYIFAVEGAEDDGFVPEVVAGKLKECDDGAGDSDGDQNRRAENPPAPMHHFVVPQYQMADGSGEEPIEAKENDGDHEADDCLLSHVDLLRDIVADVQFGRGEINRRVELF